MPEFPEHIEKQDPLDPFEKLLTRADPEVVGATQDQLIEFGHESLLEAFDDFRKKQPGLAYVLLRIARENPENFENTIKAGLVVYFSLERQLQTDKTKKAFPEEK